MTTLKNNDETRKKLTTILNDILKSKLMDKKYFNDGFMSDNITKIDDRHTYIENIPKAVECIIQEFSCETEDLIWDL